MDHGIQNGAFSNLPVASGAALKSRQIAAMSEGASPLTAEISKELPAFSTRHYYIQRSRMTNPSI